MEQIHLIFEYFQSQSTLYGLILLCLSAGIEYIFPPFPGDTVTIVGAILIPEAGWPIEGVFAAVMLGSTAGAVFNWWIGRWLGDYEHKETFIHRWLSREPQREKIETLKRRFSKHGSAYITANRFVPAFRSLFFIAAGMSNLRLRNVVFFSALSAALWNSMLLGVGYAVGYNLDRLVLLLDQYTAVVWSLLGAGVLAWVIWQVYQRWRD